MHTRGKPQEQAYLHYARKQLAAFSTPWVCCQCTCRQARCISPVPLFSCNRTTQQQHTGRWWCWVHRHVRCALLRQSIMLLLLLL
jgi:hypothetical protein